MLTWIRAGLAIVAGALLIACASTSGVEDAPVANAPAASEPAASVTAASTATASASGSAAQGAATAEAAAADASTVELQAASDESSDDDLVCRREQVTGTHRRIRRCYTRAQRDSMREESQRLMRDEFREPAVVTGGGQ